MLGLLRPVPLWAWVVTIALAWGAFQHHRAGAAGARALVAERDLAEIRAAAAKAAIDTLARTVAEQGKAVHEAEQDAARNRAGAVAAAATAVRLRDAAATAGARCSVGAATAASSPPASAAGAVLADVLGRAAEAAQQLAEHADAATTAGKLCERAYGALIRAQKP